MAATSQQPPLLSDHFSKNKQNFPSQITIIRTSRKRTPLVDDSDHF